MDRLSVTALEVAMLEQKEMLRSVQRRQMLKEAAIGRSDVRLAGVRRSIGQLLIDAGEWIRIEECERRAEDLTRETVSLSSAR